MEPRSSTPFVNVGLPVYNGAEWLAESLESLLAQDYPAFRIHLSDNGSDDATGEIGRDFASRDERLVYTRNERNIGVAPNFRKVMDSAEGPYFMWASHDDVWSPNFISALVRAHLDHPGSAIATSRTVYRKPGGELIDMRPDPPSPQGSRLVNLRVLQEYRCTSWFYGLYDLEILRRHFDEMTAYPLWGRDLIWLSSLCLRYPIAGTSEAIIYKRRHYSPYAHGAIGFSLVVARMMGSLTRISLTMGSGARGKLGALYTSWSRVGRTFGGRSVTRVWRTALRRLPFRGG